MDLMHVLQLLVCPDIGGAVPSVLQCLRSTRKVACYTLVDDHLREQLLSTLYHTATALPCP